MSAAQKSECPAAPGHDATNQKAHADFSPERHASHLIAQLEKAGHHVHRLENNGFLAARWGMTLHCPDLAALVKFAKQVGAV